MNNRDKPEIFEIKATRCLRCGGILLSEFGLKHGMGHVCKKKFDLENAPIDENQMTLFEAADPDGGAESGSTEISAENGDFKAGNPEP